VIFSEAFLLHDKCTDVRKSIAIVADIFLEGLSLGILENEEHAPMPAGQRVKLVAFVNDDSGISGVCTPPAFPDMNGERQA
jgi:hypothetical protein